MLRVDSSLEAPELQGLTSADTTLALELACRGGHVALLRELLAKP